MVARVIVSFPIFSLPFTVFTGNKLASRKAAYISHCILDILLARLTKAYLALLFRKAQRTQHTARPGRWGPDNRRPSQQCERLSINNERTWEVPPAAPLVCLLFNCTVIFQVYLFIYLIRLKTLSGKEP